MLREIGTGRNLMATLNSPFKHILRHNYFIKDILEAKIIGKKRSDRPKMTISGEIINYS